MLNFGADLNMEFLSCVSNTALPVLGLTTLAIDKSICGYNTLLSALEPLLLPKGKSEINTSTELSVEKKSESSQLIVPFIREFKVGIVNKVRF